MSDNIDRYQEAETRSEHPTARRVFNATVVTLAGGSLVFEQSPLNEALRVNAGLDVLQNTGSALAVGLTIAGITTVIEGVSSGLITLGLHTEGGAVQKLKARMQRDKITEETQMSPEEPTHGPSVLGRIANFGADVGIALGLGAGLVTLKHHIADPNPTVKKDLVTSAKATAIVSGVSGGIGYLAGGGIANAEKVGLETPAQYVIDYGTDTRFWMSALAIGYGTYFAKKGVDRLRRRNSVPEIDTTIDQPEDVGEVLEFRTE